MSGSGSPNPNAPYASDYDYTPGLEAFTSVMLVLTTIAMAARIYVRWLGKIPIGADDVLAPISYLAFLANVAANFIIAKSNFVSNVPPTPEQVKVGTKTTVSLGISYPICVLCSKLSLLFLLKRIFGMRKTWFRVGWWINFILMFPLWITVALTFGCMQIAQKHLLPEVQKNSIPTVSFVNAFTDFTILILPVGTTWNLQLSWKQRISVMSIFALGLLATIVSLVRSIRGIQATNGGWDMRYVMFQSSMMGVAEAGIIFICACLPIFGPLLVKIKEVAVKSLDYVTSRSSLGGSKVSSGMGSKLSSRKPKSAISLGSQGYHEDNIKLNEGVIHREREYQVRVSNSSDGPPLSDSRVRVQPAI